MANHACVVNIHAMTTLELNLELRFKKSRPVNQLREVNVIFEVVLTPASLEHMGLHVYDLQPFYFTIIRWRDNCLSIVHVEQFGLHF